MLLHVFILHRRKAHRLLLGTIKVGQVKPKSISCISSYLNIYIVFHLAALHSCSSVGEETLSEFIRRAFRQALPPLIRSLLPVQKGTWSCRLLVSVGKRRRFSLKKGPFLVPPWSQSGQAPPSLTCFILISLQLSFTLRHHSESELHYREEGGQRLLPPSIPPPPLLAS